MNPAPLQNKRVLVPRGAKQAKSFSALVKKLGGIPVEIPLIAFRPVELCPAIAKALEQLHTYDWIIFTSSVTVETFFAFYKNGKQLPKVAVIGDKTKEAIEKKQIPVEFTPQEFVAEGFVKEFLPKVGHGTRILIPKGNLAREYIASSLREEGAFVDELIIYETYMPAESRHELLEMLSAGKLDILSFTSPSTIDHFMDTVKGQQLDSVIRQCIVACIGPVSKRKAEQHGLTVHACPKRYTVAEMMDCVIEYLNNNSYRSGKHE